MVRVVYTPAAEFDLSQLIPAHQQEVRAWEKTVELPDPKRVGYLRHQVGPVRIWFQVEKSEIHVCDIRVLPE
jgi:mRNA-degrading endonuclease RelE of RelBE toxin-antitoxin system